MTDIISQLNTISLANTYKTHDLLDRVLAILNINFPTNEIRFDNERVAFVAEVEGYTFIVQRDLNTFTVVSRVVTGNDLIAECTVDIDGRFKETYGRMSNTDLKAKISTWFTEVGNIDVTTLQSEAPAEAEQNVPEENAEPEKEEEVKKVTAVVE
jgi:hypothetical protein